MPDNYTGRHWPLDPVDGDEIDDIVNWQLAGGGRNRGIYGNNEPPARCPNPGHAGAIWHGTPQDIYGRTDGRVIGQCSGSVLYRNT